MKVPYRLSAVIALSALSACGADLAQLQPPVGIRAIVAETGGGRPQLVVTPDAPAAVEVMYVTPGEPMFSIRVDAGGDSAIIPLTQLRPGRTYDYDVRTYNAAGIPGPVSHGVLTAPEAPPELAALNFTVHGTSSIPAVMLEVFRPSYSGFVAVNQYGEPVWSFRTKGNPQGFTRRANGNFVFLDAVNGLFEVTPGGAVVHQLSAFFAGNHLPHHDLVPTESNTILFIAQDPVMINDQLIIGESIYEWTPESGDVVKRWSSFDFYDPAVDVGPRSTPGDWLHANSLALGDHGNVILSLNWLSQVISIAPDWHTIEWRMGGPHGTVGLDSAASFQGQHTAQLLPNGHMLMFDNERDRGGAAQNSRALELSFTPDGTAHMVWSFTPSPTQYDPYVGSARRLDNGNTLVFFGIQDGFAGARGPMSAYEVKPNGSVTWQLTYDGGNINYRATPLSTIAGEVSISGPGSHFAVPVP